MDSASTYEVWYESCDGSEKVTDIEAYSISDVHGIFHDEYAGCRLISSRRKNKLRLIKEDLENEISV